MTHTLWRSSELLGEVDLWPAPGATGALAGPFRPAPAFAAVWPVFRTLQAAGALSARALGALPAGAGAEAIRARLADSGAGEAVGAALAAVEALGLEVRDASGRALAGVQVGASSFAVPIPDDLMPEQRRAAETDAAAVGVALGGPNYMLAVTPRPLRAAPAA